LNVSEDVNGDDIVRIQALLYTIAESWEGISECYPKAVQLSITACNNVQQWRSWLFCCECRTCVDCFEFMQALNVRESNSTVCMIQESGKSWLMKRRSCATKRKLWTIRMKAVFDQQ